MEPPTLPHLNEPMIEGYPDYEADSTLVDQPLDLRNEKDPLVVYFFNYQKKGPGGFEEKGGALRPIKTAVYPLIEGAIEEIRH